LVLPDFCARIYPETFEHLLMNDLAFHVFVCMKCFVGTLDMDMHVGLSFLCIFGAKCLGGPLIKNLSKGTPHEMATNTCCKC